MLTSISIPLIRMGSESNSLASGVAKVIKSPSHRVSVVEALVHGSVSCRAEPLHCEEGNLTWLFRRARVRTAAPVLKRRRWRTLSRPGSNQGFSTTSEDRNNKPRGADHPCCEIAPGGSILHTLMSCPAAVDDDVCTSYASRGVAT